MKSFTITLTEQERFNLRELVKDERKNEMRATASIFWRELEAKLRPIS